MIGASSDLIELRDRMVDANVKLDAVMAEARAIIAKHAPTISQMAEQIAANVRQLEQETTQLADSVEQSQNAHEESQKNALNAADPASESPSEPKPQMADLQQHQEGINQQLDDLFDALVEDANSQDLLDSEQRERARDADDSIAMVQEPAQQMNKALQEADDTTAPAQKAKELSKAAEQQEKTAKALDVIAQHFELLDQQLDVADTRA